MVQPPVNYVFIHGAWQSQTVFSALFDHLGRRGVTCYSLDLPGHGENSADFSSITLNTYVDSVVAFLEEIGGAENVTLVGHSMAGMVISEVAERIKVDKLIYIAAFLPKSGESLRTIADQFIESGLSQFMEFDLPNSQISLQRNGLEAILYNDCDKATQEEALASLQTQPILPFNGKVKLGARFDGTPKSYIVCLQDRAISEHDQRRMCENTQNCDVLELDAGHEPMVSMPEALSRFFG